MLKSLEITKKGTSLVAIIIAVLAVLAGCATSPSGRQAGEADTAETKQIIGITTEQDDSDYLVIIQGNQQLTYTSVKQNLPLGVLFYFPETDLDSAVPVTLMPNNAVIESVETALLDDQQQMTRVFISLKQDIPYDVAPDGTGIRISFPRPGGDTLDTAETETFEPDASAGMAASSMAAEEMADTDRVPASQLKSVFVTKFEDRLQIRIDADGAIENFKSFTIGKPARIVFDLQGLTSPYKQQQVIPVTSPFVKKIRHFGHPDKVRLVVETEDRYLESYNAQTVSGGMVIQIGTTSAAMVEPSAAPAARSEAEMAPTTTPVAAAAAPAAAVDTAKPAWVNRIDFFSQEEGKSAIIIGTTRPVEYELSKATDKMLQLKLLNTNLPRYRANDR